MVLRARALPPPRNRGYRQASYAPAKPVIGYASDEELGEQIHSGGNRHCPVCDATGLMRIYDHGVRWPCGHSRSLPGLPWLRGKPKGGS